MSETLLADAAGRLWKQGIGRPKETPAVPATLDWDLWLGPVRERPYNPAYAPANWRGASACPRCP